MEVLNLFFAETQGHYCNTLTSVNTNHPSEQTKATFQVHRVEVFDTEDGFREICYSFPTDRNANLWLETAGCLARGLTVSGMKIK